MATGDIIEDGGLVTLVAGDEEETGGLVNEVSGDEEEERDGCSCCDACVVFSGSVCTTLSSTDCVNLDTKSFTTTEVFDVSCRHWKSEGSPTTAGGCTYAVNVDFYCGCVDDSDPCPALASKPNCAVVRIGGTTSCTDGDGAGEWFLVTEADGSDRNLPVNISSATGSVSGYVAFGPGVDPDCNCPCPAGTLVRVLIQDGVCPTATVSSVCCDPIPVPARLFLTFHANADGGIPKYAETEKTYVFNAPAGPFFDEWYWDGDGLPFCGEITPGGGGVTAPIAFCLTTAGNCNPCSHYGPVLVNPAEGQSMLMMTLRCDGVNFYLRTFALFWSWFSGGGFEYNLDDVIGGSSFDAGLLLSKDSCSPFELSATVPGTGSYKGVVAVSA